MAEGFPERLAAARKAAGLTRYVLAVRLGARAATVNAWENGLRRPGLRYRHALQEMFPGLDVPEPERREYTLRGRMETTTLYLKPEQLEGLRALADELKRPVAGLVREAVDEYLAVWGE